VKYNHVGIPTASTFDGEIALPHLKMTVSDHLAAALAGQKVIIEPNSPSRGVLVAFVEVGGAPVELMQIDHEARPDL
jgi:hypothetical protein